MSNRREIFRESVLNELRRDGPMATRALYARMKELHPNLCDQEECQCGGQHPGQPEWQHEMRWAQQDLRQRKRIDNADRKWFAR
jgi:hypothetical protein